MDDAPSVSVSAPKGSIMMRVLFVFCLAALIAPQIAHAQSAAIVRALTEAFNKHDADAMRVHWSDDIVWYDVAGDETIVVASGVAAMDAGMRDYFRSFPDARSTLSHLVENGAFVTGVETAHWTSSGAARAQASVVVYEIRDAKVRRVWYYPAEKQGSK